MQVTFYGTTFDVAAPYAAGHVASANEAKAFSSWHLTTVGNRYGARVRAALKAFNEGKKKADQTEDISAVPGFDPQAEFQAAYAAFSPGVSSRTSAGPKASGDPVAAIAYRLATDETKVKILRNGLKVKDFMDTKVTVDGVEMSAFKRGVLGHLEKHRERIMAQAEAQHAQTLAAVEDDDDTITLDLPDPETQVEAA